MVFSQHKDPAKQNRETTINDVVKNIALVVKVLKLIQVLIQLCLLMVYFLCNIITGALTNTYQYTTHNYILHIYVHYIACMYHMYK